MWDKFKAKLLQLFGGLIMEDKGDGVYTISLGRVAFWATFTPSAMIWWQNVNGPQHDIPTYLYNFLMCVLGYNVSKHIGNSIKNTWGNSNNSVHDNDQNDV